MKVYEAVSNAFIKEGTTTLFGLLGDGQMTWWSDIAKTPNLKIVDTRDEGCAVTMAEGYAMATGKVGVASATQGPGLARMTTSLIVAARSHTPVVVYTSKTALNNEHLVQHLNQDQLIAATGCGYIEVLKASYAEEGVRDAFYRARRESRPYVLCVPLEVQNMECDADGDDYQPSSTLFSGQQAIRPDLERLREAKDIIAKAKKPVMVLGRGAMSPKAKEAATQLADRIGAVIATTLVAKGTLADSEYYAGVSGLFASREVIELFSEADCVIAVGARLSTHTLHGGYMYPKAKFIHIDIAPHVMMGNDRGAECYIQGDATATLQELNDELERDKIGGTGFRTAETKRILRGAGRDPAEYEIEPGTVDPREAMISLDEKLPPEMNLVSSGNAHACSFRVMHMKKRRGLQIYVTLVRLYRPGAFDRCRGRPRGRRADGLHRRRRQRAPEHSGTGHGGAAGTEVPLRRRERRGLRSGVPQAAGPRARWLPVGREVTGLRRSRARLRMPGKKRPHNGRAGCRDRRIPRRRRPDGH